MFSAKLSWLTPTASTAFLAVICSVVLGGCGPEAPPCNDAEVTSSIRDLVAQAHDDHLKDLQVQSKDIATIALETPVVTAYDEKLKVRSCKVTFTVQASADKVKTMNQYMAAITSPLVGVLDSLNPFASLTNPQGTPLQKAKAEVAQFQVWNQGPQASPEPIRKSLTYQVQKEEGKSNFYVTTNVNVSGTVPYMRVIVLADAFAKEQAKRQAKETDANAKKQAEVDRLSASGKWRKVVYILDWREPDNAAGRCHERGLVCFRGRDNVSETDAVHYQLDASKVDARTMNALDVAYRGNQPVCLVGVQKTQDPVVFTAKGYSTFRNDKGEAVDCLPGTENSDWGALVAQTKKEEAAAAAAVAGPGAAPAMAPRAPAPAPSSGPESLMSLITKYEPCGEEAVCLHTGKGNVVWMQATMMRRMDYALLDKAISSKTPVCLRDVTRTDAKNFAADGLDSAC